MLVSVRAAFQARVCAEHFPTQFAQMNELQTPYIKHTPGAPSWLRRYSIQLLRVLSSSSILGAVLTGREYALGLTSYWTAFQDSWSGSGINTKTPQHLWTGDTQSPQPVLHTCLLKSAILDKFFLFSLAFLVCNMGIRSVKIAVRMS